MKITNDINIKEFRGWSGAVDTIETIINEGKADLFDCIISELYPEGLTNTQLNDILWHDSSWIYEILGIEEE